MNAARYEPMYVHQHSTILPLGMSKSLDSTSHKYIDSKNEEGASDI